MLAKFDYSGVCESLNLTFRVTKSEWRSHAESNAISMLRVISYNIGLVERR